MANDICKMCKSNRVSYKGMTICDKCSEESTPLLGLADEGQNELAANILKNSRSVQCLTTDSPAQGQVVEEFGLVFGNSSKQAFWGLSTQADRLSRAYEAALSNLRYDAAALGANAVVGIQFALNNSTGSGATLITGSSEAVMLLGTAVTIE